MSLCSLVSIKSQGHSLTLVKGLSDFKVKCLTFGLYTQVSDSWPHGPLVFFVFLSLVLSSDHDFSWAHAFLFIFFASRLNNPTTIETVEHTNNGFYYKVKPRTPTLYTRVIQ